MQLVGNNANSRYSHTWSTNKIHLANQITRAG